jgi:SIR2-like domain
LEVFKIRYEVQIMIDPLTSLSFAVYSNKGAYALLLGSGVSRSSGIPTGWEVVLDLIRKVAALEGGDCEPDPAEWFRENYKTEPDYSQLLNEIAKTSTERQQLLRGYFEPTGDEREEGLKLPTAAHRAIARLVASGHVRVILTTNFDRLAEMALGDVGISPTVISTADQIAGSLPLVHSPVTIIKLHGDYLDTRIRNTESELTSYDASLNCLLDRVLDEYGLIVSGWSGDWDIALRAAIERCPTRRFTTFWATRSPLSEKAESLAKHRQAQIVQSKDADQFFGNVEEKVQALEDLAAPHPLSAKIAIATVKRFVVDQAARIRLHDLIYEETEKLMGNLSEPIFRTTSNRPPADELVDQIKRYKALSDVLLSVIVTGSFWGGSEHRDRWTHIVQRTVGTKETHGGMDYLIRLRRYPALLLMYGSGIAALASGNFETFAAVLTGVKLRNDDNESKELCSVVYPQSVISKDIGQMLPGLDRRHTPTNDHLHEVLRDYFREYLPNDEDYDYTFDRFEYYLGLVHADLNRKECEEGKLWGLVGRFGWRNRDFNTEQRIYLKVDREIGAVGGDWPLVQAGLFGGSIDRARSSKEKYDAFLKGLTWF